MTAFTGIWAKTSALPALRAAIHLGKLLTVLRAFTPATLFTAIVAGWTRSLRQWEVVDIHILCFWPCDDLIPVNGLDVTEIVIVEQTHASTKDIYKTINGFNKTETFIFEAHLQDIRLHSLKHTALFCCVFKTSEQIKQSICLHFSNMETIPLSCLNLVLVNHGRSHNTIE
jgi:hypothetical protein